MTVAAHSQMQHTYQQCQKLDGYCEYQVNPNEVW